MARFLDSDCTDLAMVDADTSWEIGALPRLLDHEPDFVAAQAPRRVPDDDPFCLEALGALQLDPATGLLEVEACGLAFVRLRRSVVERLAAAYPQLEFESYGARGFDFFNGGAIGGRYYGEDVAFCERWRSIGGRIWLDPDVTLSHAGTTSFAGRRQRWEGLLLEPTTTAHGWSDGRISCQTTVDGPSP